MYRRMERPGSGPGVLPGTTRPRRRSSIGVALGAPSSMALRPPCRAPARPETNTSIDGMQGGGQQGGGPPTGGCASSMAIGAANKSRVRMGAASPWSRTFVRPPKIRILCQQDYKARGVFFPRSAKPSGNARCHRHCRGRDRYLCRLPERRVVAFRDFRTMAAQRQAKGGGIIGASDLRYFIRVFSRNWCLVVVAVLLSAVLSYLYSYKITRSAGPPPRSLLKDKEVYNYQSQVYQNIGYVAAYGDIINQKRVLTSYDPDRQDPGQARLRRQLLHHRPLQDQ